MHKVFIWILFLLGTTTIVALAVTGGDYYLESLQLRPFRPEHLTLKPSGTVGHALGIVGTILIVGGIASYSTRKRAQALWNLGKLSTWLEIHIFMCVTGAALILFHTTFKVGGIAAITFWTMSSVVASGVIGRFLYVLIPRSGRGNEMTSREIDEEFDRQRAIFNETELGRTLIGTIDRTFADIRRPNTLRETLRVFFKLQLLKYSLRKTVSESLSHSAVDRHKARSMMKLAVSRAVLIQKSILLLEVEKLFYYWHVIHLPFTGIMFVTLIVHVGVALWFGYTWIF
jgi:hypothetical protein